MSELLSDADVDRAITLLALIELATNGVSVDRYERELNRLCRSHSELKVLKATDLRVAAKVIELRREFEGVEGISV